MTTSLAVFTAQIGAPSETFIRRHVEDLAPGRTVVVTRRRWPSGETFWRPQSPVLDLSRQSLRLSVRIAARIGVARDRMQERTVATFLKHHDVGAVLGEYLDEFVDFVPLLDRMALPYVVQGHGIDVSAALRESTMAARYRRFSSARAVLTRSEHQRRRLIDLGLPPSLVHVNPGGVDIPVDAPSRLAPASKRFLAIGRMVPKKGPVFLLEAFRLAAAKDPATTLDVIGDGPLLPAARQFIDACGLRARVQLHGAAAEPVKDRLLRECGVFVQHSIVDPATGDEEGLPAAIQEAMAHGMPVVSTRHAGIPEAVEDETTGLLVDEGDSVSMSEAMVRLAGDDELARRLGAAARAKAARMYSWPAERARLLFHIAGFATP